MPGAWNTMVAVIALGGLFFFIAGSIGLYRLPDVYSRLHALSKADNLGLGLMLLAAGLYTGEWFTAVKLLLIWILVLIASACLCFLIAGESLARSGEPTQKDAP